MVGGYARIKTIRDWDRTGPPEILKPLAEEKPIIKPPVEIIKEIILKPAVKEPVKKEVVKEPAKKSKPKATRKSAKPKAK